MSDQPLGPVGQRVEAKLRAALDPHTLQVIDESHKHVGHAGHRPEGETHFHVRIVAAAFAGHNRVARQRLVHTALAEELADRVHALSMELDVPQEG